MPKTKKPKKNPIPWAIAKASVSGGPRAGGPRPQPRPKSTRRKAPTRATRQVGRRRRDGESPAPSPVPPPTPVDPPSPALSLQERLLLRLVSPLNALPVQTLDGAVYLRPENIAYITTADDPKDKRLRILDRDGGEWFRFDTLVDLFVKLQPDPRFFKAHRSFIINLFAIHAILKDPKTGRLEATFGDKVPGAAGIAIEAMKLMQPLLEL